MASPMMTEISQCRLLKPPDRMTTIRVWIGINWIGFPGWSSLWSVWEYIQYLSKNLWYYYRSFTYIYIYIYYCLFQLSISLVNVTDFTRFHSLKWLVRGCLLVGSRCWTALSNVTRPVLLVLYIVILCQINNGSTIQLVFKMSKVYGYTYAHGTRLTSWSFGS